MSLKLILALLLEAATLVAQTVSGNVSISGSMQLGGMPGAPSTAATPTFSPAAGAIASGTVVTASTSTPGCSAYIYLSLTGTPTANDTNSTTIALTADQTVRARVIGCPSYIDSAVGSVAYTVTASVCQPITVSRPRLLFPAPGYGGRATMKDVWAAKKAANPAEFSALVSTLSAYLSTDPNPPYFHDVAFGMAWLYALNPTTYAAYGPRAIYMLNKAVDNAVAGYGAPSVQVTAATNANPVVFTTATAHGLTSGVNVRYVLWGGTGAWAAINFTGAGTTVAVIDSTHFSIPVDSTSFGAFSDLATVSSLSYFNSGNQARWYLGMMADAYDWAHDQLGTISAYNQAKIRNIMMASAQWAVQYPYGNEGLGLSPFTGIKNLTIGPNSSAAQVAIALDGDMAGTTTMCSTIRDRFVSLVIPQYTTGGFTSTGLTIFPIAKDGSYVEGAEYAPEVHYYLLTYMLAMQSATGEDFHAAMPLWFGRAMEYLAADVSPAKTGSNPTGQYEATMFGDIQAGSQHRIHPITHQVVELLARYFASTGDTTNAGYAQWWLTHTHTAADLAAQGQATASPSLYKVSEGLWYDSTLATIDYTAANLGRDYFAPNFGLALSRTDWTSSAMWVGFRSGTQRGFMDEDHWHADALSIPQIYYKKLLTNNMWGYQSSGAALAVGSPTFQNAPWTANADQPSIIYQGSQPRYPDNSYSTYGIKASMPRYEATTGYFYVRGDASSVYRGMAAPGFTPTVNTAVRDFLFLKNLKTVVVLDRLAYDSPQSSKFNLQALRDPGTPSGSAFVIQSADATESLSVSVVSPSSPTYTVVSPATQLAESAVNSTTQYRIEIPQGSATSHTYLVVMEAGDTGFTPATVTTLTASNLKAAQFTGNVVAGVSDTVISGVTRSYTFTQTGTVRHTIIGLMPSTAYAVNRSTPGSVSITDAGGPGGNVVTTSSGLLIFDTP